MSPAPHPDPAASPAPDAGRALLRLLPALAPALIFVPIVLAPPLTADGGAILEFSRRWLAGERLYVDLIDINPPLIFALNAIPAELARLTGLDAVLCLQACLLALCALVWRLCHMVRARAAEGPVERVLCDVLPGLMCFCAGYLFGERETLMVAMSLPYLFAAAGRGEGQAGRGGVAAGLLAGLGFALKPHFLAVPALVEAALLLRRGWAALRDPAPWLIAAVALAHAASVALLFPAYLSVMIPWALHAYRGEAPVSPPELLLRPRLAAACLLLGLQYLAWRRGWARGRDMLPALFGLAGLGALAAALVQDKGFGQHILAVQLFALALASVLAARWFDARGVGGLANGAVRGGAMISALFALYCAQAGRAPLVEMHYPGSDIARLTRVIRRLAPGGEVMGLSAEIALFPAVNYAPARMAGRFMALWTLRGAYADCPADGARYRPPAAMAPVERYVFETVPADLARERPRLVVVDREAGIRDCAGAFDFLAYFMRSPVFAAAWRDYRLAEAWGRYQIYVRAP